MSSIISSKRSGGDELMHLHVAFLTNPKDAVGGLIFDSGIPPAVEVENVVGAGQVQPVPPALRDRIKIGGA